MRRAAIYARYSTDRQNDRSVEDQIALCQTYADRERLHVVASFYDRARTGASMFERDGLLALMAETLRVPLPFEVLIVEHTDRLARDMEDGAGLHKRLTFAGIEIRAVHSGTVDTAMIGLFSLVGQLQREEGAKKVRRGLAGVVRSGRVAGSLGYGYRLVLGKPGEREIDPEKAAIVRRIFAEYLDGRSPRRIAGDLNRDGVASPRGGLWNASTINGDPARGLGILNNELYAGRIVWNRSRKVRSPYTGRRLERRNDLAEREISAAPDLRIIDEESWAKVRAAKDAGVGTRPERQRRPVHLLSGLLRCATCGSGMSAKGRDKTGKMRMICSAVKESGSCGHSRSYYLPSIESAVVDGLREQLRDPRLIEIFVRQYNEERRRLAGAASRDRAKLERRLGEASREFERVMTGYVKGFMPEPEAEERLPTLRAERDRIAAELAAAEQEPEVLALHPTLIRDYLRQVDELAGELATFAGKQDAPSANLTAVFRSLVQAVTVHPVPAGAPVDVEFTGRLAQLIGPEAFPAGRFVGGNGGAG